jgi:hypothetical protein
MGIRGELFSTKVALENRTYFFNVKENRMGDLYLNIVESKNRETGGFERQSVILFAEDLTEFLKGFDESLQVLEKAAREKRRSSFRKAAGSGETFRDGETDGRTGAGRSSGKTFDRGVGKAVGRATGGPVGRAAGRSVGGAAGKPVGRPAGTRTAGRTDDRTAEFRGFKREQKPERPKRDRGDTETRSKRVLIKRGPPKNR